MIDKYGKMLVYLAEINYGEENGGYYTLSVHDTYEGAREALKANGFRPSCVFTSDGELYACHGKTADEYPVGHINTRLVRP